MSVGFASRDVTWYHAIRSSSHWQLDLDAHLVTFIGQVSRMAVQSRHRRVRLVGQKRKPIAMQPNERSYFETTSRVRMGDRDFYVIDGVNERPGPCISFST